MRTISILLTIGMLLWLQTACATSRGILDVRVESTPDPSSDMAIILEGVDDARTFQVDPRDPSIPSLKNDEDISNPNITARAIARKRNGYGMALGDILLPEDRTVPQVAAEAVAEGFRKAGFLVVRPEDLGAHEALPVRVSITEFWSWMTPGFWAVALEFETTMNIKANLPQFQSGRDVRGYIRLRTAGASSSKWMNTIDRGLQDFISNLTGELKESKHRLEDTRGENAEHNEIDECVNSCLRLTERSRDECFDSCIGR
jgi:hypothetical protein